MGGNAGHREVTHGDWNTRAGWKPALPGIKLHTSRLTF